jgi:hypothetical protein
MCKYGRTAGNLKPLSREGCLDVKVLNRHGLSAISVCDDPLLFFQMLFPLMSPSKSEVDDKHQMPYFSNGAKLTKIYALSKGGGIGIGKDWKPCYVSDLVKWTAVPGNPRILSYQWKKGNTRYDPVICNGIECHCWLDIKRFLKPNMNYEEKPWWTLMGTTILVQSLITFSNVWSTT